MRVWLSVVLVVAACKGGDNGGAVKVAITAPTVTVATALAKDAVKPPYLYLVDRTGTVRLAAANSWTDLDANKLRIANRPRESEMVDPYVREQVAMGRDPVVSITAWDHYNTSDLELESLEDLHHVPMEGGDDPPPPEEEDKPDDGEDERYGTGTTVTLDEGKMGKKESDRAEGEYNMQNNQDQQLARQQVIEAARNAGKLGSPDSAGASSSDGLPYAHHTNPRPHADGTPTRVAEVAGVVPFDGVLEHMHAMIVIAPTAKATALIELVGVTNGAIAVSHDGKLRPLHIEFGSGNSAEARTWIEVRVSTAGIVIEAVPEAPIAVATVDAKAIADAVSEARSVRDLDASTPVDVLVDADVDVQRLVDVLVALDAAGARVFGLGSTPNSDELARRGHRIPTLWLGQPSSQGDLSKAVIRRVMKSSKLKLAACYVAALANNPALTGNVTAVFYITPNGNVATASANGVDDRVAACMAAVIKNLTFPKPAGGGGVQVYYPLFMQP